MKILNKLNKLFTALNTAREEYKRLNKISLTNTAEWWNNNPKAIEQLDIEESTQKRIVSIEIADIDNEIQELEEQIKQLKTYKYEVEKEVNRYLDTTEPHKRIKKFR